jgi:hypothetical protein
MISSLFEINPPVFNGSPGAKERKSPDNGFQIHLDDKTALIPRRRNTLDGTKQVMCDMEARAPAIAIPPKCVVHRELPSTRSPFHGSCQPNIGHG